METAIRPAAASNGSSCCHGGTGIQAAGQEAYNKQYADSNAESKQIEPSNTNISVRVLSDGNDGDVEQSNNSSAESKAKNDNDTSQTVDQSQSGAGGTGIQEALQKAGSQQAAKSNAESTQVKPSNKNISVRVLSEGDNGSVNQSNNSSAESKAENDNDLDQTLPRAEWRRVL